MLTVQNPATLAPGGGHSCAFLGGLLLGPPSCPCMTQTLVGVLVTVGSCGSEELGTTVGCVGCSLPPKERE